MTPTTDTKHCATFREHLDAWLAGEFSPAHMQEHHDSCASCRMEARLARDIDGILGALPAFAGPDILTPAVKPAGLGRTLIARLLTAWRQPLVYVPALALVVTALFVTQLAPLFITRTAPPGSSTADTAIEPELVVIDGRTYTREEIQKASADLELALRYLDKYGPAQVISAELNQGETRAPRQNRDDDRADAPAPTI